MGETRRPHRFPPHPGECRHRSGDLVGDRRRSAVFDEKIGSPYAGIRWKTERPSNDAIAAVVMQFGVNRHWLLTGEGEMLISSPPPHDQQKQPPPPLLLNEYPYSIHTKSIHDFVEEVLTSTDENAINALKYGMVHTRRPGAFACGRGQHRKGNE